MVGDNTPSAAHAKLEGQLMSECKRLTLRVIDEIPHSNVHPILHRHQSLSQAPHCQQSAGAARLTAEQTHLFERPFGNSFARLNVHLMDGRTIMWT